MNASQPWRDRRKVIEMCLELALDAQEKTGVANGGERLADEMAARVFAMAELCNSMGWSRSSRLLRKAHDELLNEASETDCPNKGN